MNTTTLDAIAAQLDRNTQAVATLRERHDDAALARKPAAGGWSACECIEHLHITTELYAPRVRALIAQHGKPGSRPDDPVVRPGWFAAWFIRQASPANPRRLPAPKAFRVEPGAAGVASFERFAASQRTLGELIHQARGRPLNNSKLATPVSRLIRFTLGEALLLLVTHQQRHIAQADRAVS